MKSRPHGHRHTSHQGLLPTLPTPYQRLASHREAMLEESTSETESNSTYHREMDSADPDQLPHGSLKPKEALRKEQKLKAMGEKET